MLNFNPMKNGSIAIDWRTLLRDLAILVIGIMLSLTMNECRQNAKAGKDEDRIMRQLIEDIKVDTLKLHEMIGELRELQSMYDPLTSPAGDTLPTYQRYGLASSVLYISFQPSRTAMYELSYSNRSGDIERRDLVAQATALYENDYRMVTEVAEKIADFVLEVHIPFLTDELFYSPDTTFDPEEMQALEAFIYSSSFQQRTYWLEVLWMNQEQTAREALDKARELLHELEKAY
ncbi:hypothetical protein CEQ90_12210 [Lewinellaceae bacterium SD302]|nr:hypothetical protein CEQ90_12210 [Lewinellaceae bacterium SD302]